MDGGGCGWNMMRRPPTDAAAGGVAASTSPSFRSRLRAGLPGMQTGRGCTYLPSSRSGSRSADAYVCPEPREHPPRKRHDAIALRLRVRSPHSSGTECAPGRRNPPNDGLCPCRWRRARWDYLRAVCQYLAFLSIYGFGCAGSLPAPLKHVHIRASKQYWNRTHQ